MNSLKDYKEDIHSCSKCGLCQSVCPIYKITGNDCTVSRGQFIMLGGLIKGDLKMSKTLNRYLDLCLKCSACSKFCPSGIDVVNIISVAKAEYFKNSRLEKLISFIQRYVVFGMLVNLLNLFSPKPKSKKFDKKVLYFGGCGAKFKGTKNIIKIMNSLNIEVVTPNFDCCGIPFFVRGDLETFEHYKESFKKTVEKYGINDVITACASCEKSIKSYEIPNLNIKNIFEYINENNLSVKLKKPVKVTFHKPCNLNNYEDIKKILENTENLEYIEMENFDKCCGYNGLFKFSEYKTFLKLFSEKRRNIVSTNAKTVLTACLACEATLKMFSFGRYKVKDLTDFLAKFI